MFHELTIQMKLVILHSRALFGFNWNENWKLMCGLLYM